MTIEGQIRVAIRDAVNRPSRKPFYWGGLKGYQQLQAIGQALQEVSPDEPETSYLQRLTMQVERAVEKSRSLAQDVQAAHTQLRRIAQCLRYPSPSDEAETPLSSQQVKQEMETLLEEFQPDFKRCPAQAALHGAWHRRWQQHGPDWLHCYDIPGLPPDNLRLEALFGPGFATINAGSVVVNRPVNCGILVNVRFCFWLTAKKICWNNCVRFPWRSIKNAVGCWLKLRPRASYCAGCIVIL